MTRITKLTCTNLYRKVQKIKYEAYFYTLYTDPAIGSSGKQTQLPLMYTLHYYQIKTFMDLNK